MPSRNVQIVVDVFMINCQVSLKAEIGPVSAQRPMETRASKKTCHEPATRVMR